jgi:hypothetical protein
MHAANTLKGRIPRSFRQLEFGLMIVAVVFLGQLLWVSMRLHETENRPVVDTEKDLSKVFYRDNVVKVVELTASEKPAPLQGEAGISGSSKSAVKELKTEVQNSLQQAAVKASESVKEKEDIKRKKRQDRRRRKRNSWDPGTQGLKGDPIPLKINLPVFVPSLPKSGTTSIWQYFNCKCGNTSRHEMTFRTQYSPLSLSLCFNFRRWAPSLSPVGKGQRY